jgi:hypothetical protein
MNRRLIAGLTCAVALSIAIVGGVLLTNGADGASTACNNFMLSGNVMSAQCGAPSASFIVGTSLPSTSTTTVAPTTSTTKATTTTTAVPETTSTTQPTGTTTTTVPAQLTCAAFNGPTNSFTLNDQFGNPNQINTPTPLFTLQTDGARASYTVKVDNTVLSDVVTNYTSATACVKTPPLTDGLHTISAVEIAPVPQQVAPYTFVVDTVAPSPPTITSASFVSPYVRLSGTGIATFSVKVFESFSLRGGSSVGSTGLWSVAISRPSGSYDLYAVQMDKAGNQSAPSNVVTVSVP